MSTNSPYALLVYKLDLRNWFISRSHLLNDRHRLAVGELLDEQLATSIARLGGMAGIW